VTAPQTFAYHRSVAPLMWVFVALASVELVVAHLLVSVFAGRTAALVLSAAMLAGVLWLVAAIAAMRRLPVVLDDARLIMRVGSLKCVEVPVGTVASIRRDWDAAALKAEGVRNLALIAYPNVLVDLDPPLSGRRPVRAVAHRLDDPAAFAAAIERLVAGR